MRKKDMQARIDQLESDLRYESGAAALNMAAAKRWRQAFWERGDILYNQKEQIAALATENGELRKQLKRQQDAFDTLLGTVNDATCEAFAYLDSEGVSVYEFTAADNHQYTVTIVEQ